MRASIQANGTPNSTASDVAHREQYSDRRSAVRELSEVRIDQRVPPWRLPHQAEERQGEERDGGNGQDEDGNGEALSPDAPAASGNRWRGRRRHGALKPYFARMACPSPLSRKSMKAASVSGFFDALTLAIGYLATTLMSSGISTPDALSPAALTSVV